MPPRRSERLRLRLLREVTSPDHPGAEPGAANDRRLRRRSDGTRGRLTARQGRTNAVVVRLDQRDDPRTWLQLEAHATSSAFLGSNGEADEVLALRLLSLFIRIALLESPTLAQLTRRNPNQGVRKLFRIIRFLFFRR